MEHLLLPMATNISSTHSNIMEGVWIKTTKALHQISRDPCKYFPCENGQCVAPNDVPRCECFTGYIYNPVLQTCVLLRKY
ncbi:hypothetical protein EB796_017408 [Bugula neritina]|uniref:EGF-like domain-containing protein n=1 Tax=Bugula neritina TaxID=10212 RepID=A0A7J7JE14_BUGNE|nr:hypothetical protein EB796_017408 [Bugula neritina]